MNKKSTAPVTTISPNNFEGERKINKPIRIAINGFGRIGRAAFKLAFLRSDIDVVAINDLTPVESLSYLLKYDTAYGAFKGSVSHTEGGLVVDGKNYRVLSQENPEKLPWKNFEIDVVLECTGRFKTYKLASSHIKAGAKKVIISAPTKDTGIRTFVFGTESLDLLQGEKNDIISNASCTTNNVSPVLQVLSSVFGVEKALMSTMHAYTATQSLIDGFNKKDPRRGRAAAMNIVPTSTGAAKSTQKVLSSVNNLFDGIAFRVPLALGSVSDITALLKRDVTVEEVNSAFTKAESERMFKGILKAESSPIVSSDIIGSTYSAIVDLSLTRVVGRNLVKVVAWYDNEMGYSARLLDMVPKVLKR